MSNTQTNMYCQDCGTEIFESAGLAVEDRSPCPNCGSKARAFHVTISDTIAIYEMLGIKGKRPGQKRPFTEQKVGDDLHRKTGLWMKLKRIIDRDNDAYQETVSDPRTGQVVHHTDEPLSQHRGHGSAKRKR
ncbi:MAG: zinc ribbon domain-containing protein [Blastocatellia bacterium]|nr:zinc ribbon domain-containing protein [Blastocatellia bacterium]